VSLGFNPAPIGETGWSILILGIVLMIYLLVLFTRNDYVFAGVGLWATIGVLIERIDPLNAPQPEIALVSLIGVILLAMVIIIRLIVQYKAGNLQFLRRTS
jgi:hypothetical protein